MSRGMELDEGTLTIARERSELDEEVIQFTSILDDRGVDYVIVSGYVAILTGRSRGTEDVDIVLERLSAAETEALAETLRDRGYWGVAMPLDEMEAMLSGGDRMRIAEDGEIIPNFELWFVHNDVEREALTESLPVELGDDRIEISSIELQIAFKLRLARQGGTTSGKDFEDALHLFRTFDEQLNTEQLEAYIDDLGVEDYYDELQRD